MDLKPILAAKSQLTFSERLRQTLKMQVATFVQFSHVRPARIDKMPAKTHCRLSFPMKNQLTSRKGVSLPRKPFTDMHNQKSVQFIRKPDLESKLHLGGLLPALQHMAL